jgi:hypothetical protein
MFQNLHPAILSEELLPKPGVTLQGQLNTAKFEPGLDEVKNSAGMNHALRLSCAESRCVENHNLLLG